MIDSLDFLSDEVVHLECGREIGKEDRNFVL
jgi:hypothetical protein